MRLTAVTNLNPSAVPASSGTSGFANFEEPSNANLTDLGVKDRIAWLFLSGLGVDRHDIRFEPKNPLAYLEASLEIDRPPHPFHKTTNHRLIGATVDGTDYPIVLQHDGAAEHIDLRAGKIMLWSSAYLFSETEERIVDAARGFLEAGTSKTITEWARISFPSYGQRLRHIVSFPGVYYPINPYVKPLIRCALQRISAAMYKKDDIRVLVLGCGAGIEAVEIARATGLAVDATDINPLAVANTKASSLLAGLQDRIHSWQSDGLNGVMDKYDFIVFCAPVPSSPDRTDANRFDPHGRVLTEVFNALRANLRKGGRMLVMNRESIDGFVPSYIASECVLPFLVNGHSYAIHQLTVK